MLDLTRDELIEIIYGNREGWSLEPGTKKITGKHRWADNAEAVFKHEISGKHYMILWDEPSSESQDGQGLCAYGDPEISEVEQREVTVTKWVPVDSDS